MRRAFLLLPFVLLFVLSCSGNVRFSSRAGSGTGAGERPAGKPVPRPALPEESPVTGGHARLFQEGVASYYAHEFNGRQTANGEIFDMNDMTAAHQTLAFNTRVRVENQDNGTCVTVRINDRGPFKKDRIIDLSLAAGKSIGLLGPGSARVKLFILDK